MFFNQARARIFMRECGLDALIAASHLNITYFTGYFCWLDPTIRGYMLQPGAPASLALPGYAVFPLEGEPALVLNPLFAVNGADLWVRDLHVFGASGVDESLTSDELPQNYRRIHDLLLEPPRASSSLEALVRILEARGLTAGRLGVELEGLTPDRKAELAQALPGATLLDASNLIRLVRMVKNDYEIDLLTQSAAINEQAGMQVLSEARPGTTLGEMNDRYRILAAREGADFDHFCIGLGGLGMATEPDYALGEDDVMMVDFGCIYRRCFSDTGTTLALKELSDPLMRRFEAVRDSVAAGVDQMRPGVRCSAVRGAMWQVLEELGLTASYPHGHGVGIDVRDYPTVVADNGLRVSDDCIDVASDMPLEENMVLNLEASMFLPGVGSLQMERSLVVTADGCRDLVPQDRSRPFIPR
jgi:Xaa-Pro dipeptidase